MSTKTFAIIPARGGSKRIPRKNIRVFHGRPMIGWTIAAARASGLFDHILVSTDDVEIAAIARTEGAETPFMRPADLSDDHTPTRPVVNHAIEAAAALYGMPDFVCCLYATAPFMRAEDLLTGFDLLQSSAAEFAFSVTSFAFPIQRALRLMPNGRVNMFAPEHAMTRSQDLEEAWHDAGQFYWGRTDAFLANRKMFSEAAVPVILPRDRVQDIDTPEDWCVAERLFAAQRAERIS